MNYISCADLPPRLSEIYRSAEEEFDTYGAFFLEDGYVTSLCERIDAFKSTVHALEDATSEMRTDREAAVYALFVCRAMYERELFGENLSLFTFPEAKYPFLSLLCFLPHVEGIYRRLKEMGLPDDVVRDTIGQFEDCIFLHEERFGCLGFAKRYFDHMQRYVDMRILNIGRLRFEIYTVKDACVLESRLSGEQVIFQCRGEMNSEGLYADTPPVTDGDEGFAAFFEETDSEYTGTPVDKNGRCQRGVIRLSKSEYFIRVPEGADCIAVHIPAKGALTREACEESYARAEEIFRTVHPKKNFKAFRCHSWMMAPELGGILKPGAKLLDFQAHYLKHPCKTRGEDVFNFVFKTPNPGRYEDLPEETSLQRALKEMYLSGKYLYEYNGILPI